MSRMQEHNTLAHQSRLQSDGNLPDSNTSILEWYSEQVDQDISHPLPSFLPYTGTRYAWSEYANIEADTTISQNDNEVLYPDNMII